MNVWYMVKGAETCLDNRYSGWGKFSQAVRLNYAEKIPGSLEFFSEKACFHAIGRFEGSKVRLSFRGDILFSYLNYLQSNKLPMGRGMRLKKFYSFLVFSSTPVDHGIFQGVQE